jgi:hypothetical protein
MSIWSRPLSKWLKRAPAAAEAPPPPAPTPPPPAKPVAAAPKAEPATPLAIDAAAQRDAADALQAPFVAWLLDLATAASPGAAADAAGRNVLLGRLDAATTTDAQCNALLPRAPQVVPQLMKALRDEHYASADLALRLSKDAELAAEVIRLANHQQRADSAPVADLAHAVTAIGSDGLRRVITKSVLRPMFDARGTSLSARAAAQIWLDSDRKARLCVALAPHAGVDPLDAYLAGLLHNTGWTASLRALDTIPEAAAQLEPERLDAAFADALLRRRDRLFGRLVRPWDVGPALNALADEVGSAGIATARSPLGRVLHYADRLAMLHAVARSDRLPGHNFAAHLDRLPASVRDAYVTTLSRG